MEGSMTAVQPRPATYAHSSLSSEMRGITHLASETQLSSDLPIENTSDTHLPSGMSPLNQTYSLNGRPEEAEERLASLVGGSSREREFQGYR